MLHVDGVMSGQQVRGKGGKADSRARCGPPPGTLLYMSCGEPPLATGQDPGQPLRMSLPLKTVHWRQERRTHLLCHSSHWSVSPGTVLKHLCKLCGISPHRELGTTSSPVTRDWPQHLPRAWDRGRRDAVRLPMAGGERPRGFRPARWDTVLQPVAAM